MADRLEDPATVPASCFECRAREHSPWCGASRAGTAELDRAKLALRYRPGQIIFAEGDPCRGIFCISSGTVALRRSGPSEFGPSGSDTVTRLCHPGDTLGYLAFLADRPHGNTAEASTESQICFVERATLRRILDASPTVAHRFLCRMTHATEELEKALACRSLPARARLANVLLMLKDRYATADETGCLELELPLSRGTLASLVGVRPESLSRAIRELDRAGVAQFQGRSVIVRDLDALLDEVEIESRGAA